MGPRRDDDALSTARHAKLKLVTRHPTVGNARSCSCNQHADRRGPSERSPRRFWRIILAVALVIASERPSAAADPKWEIEVRGGGMRSSNPSAGTTALPPPGPVVVLPPVPLGGISSRVVPSWYFGDGALQFNQAIGFRLVPITPLDGVLQNRFAERRPGASFGIRVRRSLGSRFAAELAVDEAFDRLALSTSSMKGIEDSRLSFVTAWNTFFKGVSGGTQMVTSNATVSDRSGRQLIAAGSLVFDLGHVGKITPYASAGGGYISNHAATPSVQLVGNYRVTLAEKIIPAAQELGAPPFDSKVIAPLNVLTR